MIEALVSPTFGYDNQISRLILYRKCDSYIFLPFYSRGKIHYMDMFALLKQIDPPLGFGSKCPDLLAYKRLVRMNMPVDVEGKVHFSSTLFSLVRVNLTIFMRSMDEMDQADQELRHTIGRIWPFTKRDGKLDLLVPPPPGKISKYIF